MTDETQLYYKPSTNSFVGVKIFLDTVEIHNGDEVFTFSHDFLKENYIKVVDTRGYEEHPVTDRSIWYKGSKFSLLHTTSDDKVVMYDGETVMRISLVTLYRYYTPYMGHCQFDTIYYQDKPYTIEGVSKYTSRLEISDGSETIYLTPHGR